MHTVYEHLLFQVHFYGIHDCPEWVVRSNNYGIFYSAHTCTYVLYSVAFAALTPQRADLSFKFLAMYEYISLVVYILHIIILAFTYSIYCNYM